MEIYRQDLFDLTFNSVPFVDIYVYAVSFLDILYRSDRWMWEDKTKE